jgi:hypothetical protein
MGFNLQDDREMVSPPAALDQSGPRMAHRASQKVFTAAATPLLMMSRSSGEAI